MAPAPGDAPGRSPPQQPIDELLARYLARHVEGFERLESCERLSGGASQETYRVVLRASGRVRQLALRRAAGGGASRIGGPGLCAEAELMRVARAAGVPEPEVLGVFAAEDGLGDGFLMEWLEGETLGSRIVRSEALAAIRPHLARRCGEVLARIHAIDLRSSGLEGALETAPPRQLVETTWQRYRELETPQPMIDYTARWLLEHLPSQHQMSLVHGDFRNGNLMVSPRGIVAVLDWELAHVGDPMRDLGWLCTGSWRFGSELPVGGFGNYQELFDGYASVTGREVVPEQVRYWEVFGSFWWAVGCLLMAQQYRAGPDRSVERAAIGRRSSECQVDCVNLLIPGPVEPAATPGQLPSGHRAAGDLPSAGELLRGVRDLLRDDLTAATQGRMRFLARVAANALDVVLRETESGEAVRRQERLRLQRLLGTEGELEELRWRLVRALREEAMALDDPDLVAVLRESTVQRLAIDQPTYPALRNALSAGGAVRGSEC